MQSYTEHGGHCRACPIVSDDVFCMLVSHCNTAQRTRATSLLLGCPLLLFPVLDLLETRGAWVCDPSASGRLHKGRIDDLSLLGALGAWCSVRVGACLCAHVCVCPSSTQDIGNTRMESLWLYLFVCHMLRGDHRWNLDSCLMCAV